MANLANFAAPFLVVCALLLGMGETSSANLQIYRKDLRCPPLLQLHWSLRIAWDQPKILPPPGLILRHRFAGHNLLIACSSAQCLMAISQAGQTQAAQGTI